MSATVSQAEFARRLNVARSYITKLKADGRIVLAEDGGVDVEASRRRIIETADPNRDDVVSRWAQQRGETGIQPAGAGRALIEDDEEEAQRSSTYADARARKESAAADMAEMERDKLRGLLIERAAVEAAVEDVMTTVRQSLEQQPSRIAPMLVGGDLDQIRATLKQEINSVLADMVRDFQKAIRQAAGEGES